MIYNWKRIAIIAISLFIVAEAVFEFNIVYPRTVNFDEVQYVPAAKAFLSLSGYRNAEHPPLAKELIAIGLAVAGDNQLGWRVMSTIFGALTLVGMFLLSLALFKDEAKALAATAFTF